MNSTIDTIVFDLGNVLIDIDYNRPIEAFQKLARPGVNIRELLGYTHQIELFDQWERGELSATEFRHALRQWFEPHTTDEQIDNAWKTILISYPEWKFRMLDKLRSHYRIFALSNINEIHVQAINETAQNAFGRSEFSDFFHRAVYSNEVGSRKPEERIYLHIQELTGLRPESTLFIDDKAENVETALRLGWQARVLPHPDQLLPLLRETLPHVPALD
jgi:FMN phosphatase YigB (HAD superfamily)